MATTTFSLKLFVDPTSNRIVFAEAGKDFVDFLFNVLALPVGTVTSLVTKQEMVGCIGNLYDSVQNLSENYVHSKANNSTLLKVKPMVFPIAASNASVSLPFKQTSGNLYKCSVLKSILCECVMTNDHDTECPFCQNVMNQLVPVTYMVTDDLVVMPRSDTSIVTLLSKFSVKDVKYLEEKVIDVGKEKKELELLRAMMQSKTVLTEVFLGKEVR